MTDLHIPPHAFEPIFGGPPAVGETDCERCPLPKANRVHQVDCAHPATFTSADGGTACVTCHQVLQSTPLTVVDALNYAILGLNTHLYPDATEQSDYEALLNAAEDATDVLCKLRDVVRAIATIPFVPLVGTMPPPERT